ncbi:hypothetical protein [uncultured Fluviicola sp.]|uniref:hypothetical protein n=1 Tax=uncultured Fluviicola sp. TaxID=463303 RepID=UPI0025E9DD42|nr:hypothetical protein [uncultured Fluviicola sp.]
MMPFIQKYQLLILVFAAGINILSCTKKKTPVSVIPEPTNWELIPGTYKMYDTLGNYLNDMSISHWTSFNEQNAQRDTFQFNNFDGQFIFKEFQPEVNPSNWPKHSFYIGSHQPLYDSNNDRWQLYGYEARFSNDTIYIRYQIQNILYYIEDVRPYENRTVKCIGVKQH